MRKELNCLASVIVFAFAAGAYGAQQPFQEKEQILWQKFEAAINEVDRNPDGFMGMAIFDRASEYALVISLHDTGNP